MAERKRIIGIGVGAVAVIVLIRVAAVVLLSGMLGERQPDTTTTTAPTPTVTQVVFVLHATRDIHRGSRVQASDVALVGWPITDELPIPAWALTAATPDDDAILDQVTGRIARVDIIKGQPILEHMLMDSE